MCPRHNHSSRNSARLRGVALCGRLLCLLAALAATGLAWDFLQFFAWGTMYAQNVREGDAAGAFAHTFSEEGRCSLCKTIEKARQGDNEGETSLPGGLRGWLLPLSSSSITLCPPPARAIARVALPLALLTRPVQPALPPPR